MRDKAIFSEAQQKPSWTSAKKNELTKAAKQPTGTLIFDLSSPNQ
jgi:hypothetical protein